MKNIFKSNRGFTIVEVLVVVVLIGILSSIAIPSYMYYQEKARKNVVTTILLNGHRAVEIALALDERPSEDLLVNALDSGVIIDSDLYPDFFISSEKKWCVGVLVEQSEEYGSIGASLGCINQDGDMFDKNYTCQKSGTEKGACLVN